MTNKVAGYSLVLPSTSKAADDDSGPQYYRIPFGSFSARKVVLVSLALLTVLVLLGHLQLGSRLPLRRSSLVRSSGSQRFWGPHSPYYSVEEYQPPPNGCSVTQASALDSDIFLV